MNTCKQWIHQARRLMLLALGCCLVSTMVQADVQLNQVFPQTIRAAVVGGPDPVWNILNNLPVKPQGWNFVNPLPGLTGEIQNPGYWTINLDELSQTELSQLDVIYVPPAFTAGLTPLQRQKLRRFVDAGGVLWAPGDIANDILPPGQFGSGWTGPRLNYMPQPAAAYEIIRTSFTARTQRRATGFTYETVGAPVLDNWSCPVQTLDASSGQPLFWNRKLYIVGVYEGVPSLVAFNAEPMGERLNGPTWDLAWVRPLPSSSVSAPVAYETSSGARIALMTRNGAVLSWDAATGNPTGVWAGGGGFPSNRAVPAPIYCQGMLAVPGSVTAGGQTRASVTFVDPVSLQPLKTDDKVWTVMLSGAITGPMSYGLVNDVSAIGGQSADEMLYVPVQDSRGASGVDALWLGAQAEVLGNPSGDRRTFVPRASSVSKIPVQWTSLHVVGGSGTPSQEEQKVVYPSALPDEALVYAWYRVDIGKAGNAVKRNQVLLVDSIATGVGAGPSRAMLGAAAIGPNDDLVLVGANRASASAGADLSGMIGYREQLGAGRSQLKWRWEMVRGSYNETVNGEAKPVTPTLEFRHPLTGVTGRLLEGTGLRFTAPPAVYGQTAYGVAEAVVDFAGEQIQGSVVMAFHTSPNPEVPLGDPADAGTVVTLRQYEAGRSTTGTVINNQLQVVLTQRTSVLRLDNLATPGSGTSLLNPLNLAQPVVVKVGSRPEVGPFTPAGWSNLKWYVFIPGVAIGAAPVVSGEVLYLAGQFGGSGGHAALLALRADPIRQYGDQLGKDMPICGFNGQPGVLLMPDLGQASKYNNQMSALLKVINDHMTNLSVGRRFVTAPAVSRGSVALAGDVGVRVFTYARTLIGDGSRVVQLDPGGRPVWTLNAADVEPTSGETAYVSRPSSADMMPDGTVLLADTGQNRLLRVDTGGRAVNVFSWFTDAPTPILPGGPFVFRQPTDAGWYMRADGNVRFMVADTGNARLLELVLPAGATAPRLEWSSSSAVSGNDVLAASGRLRYSAVRVLRDAANQPVVIAGILSDQQGDTVDDALLRGGSSVLLRTPGGVGTFSQVTVRVNGTDRVLPLGRIDALSIYATQWENGIPMNWRILACVEMRLPAEEVGAVPPIARIIELEPDNPALPTRLRAVWLFTDADYAAMAEKLPQFVPSLRPSSVVRLPNGRLLIANKARGSSADRVIQFAGKVFELNRDPNLDGVYTDQRIEWWLPESAAIDAPEFAVRVP